MCFNSPTFCVLSKLDPILEHFLGTLVWTDGSIAFFRCFDLSTMTRCNLSMQYSVKCARIHIYSQYGIVKRKRNKQEHTYHGRINCEAVFHTPFTSHTLSLNTPAQANAENYTVTHLHLQMLLNSWHSYLVFLCSDMGCTNLKLGSYEWHYLAISTALSQSWMHLIVDYLRLLVTEVSMTSRCRQMKALELLCSWLLISDLPVVQTWILMICP